MENSKRFINAFNKIDKALRIMCSLRPSLSFTDVVRRAATVSPYVKRYEDELLSYARLRNAIIHNADESKTIAEPHDDVTCHLEALAKFLSAPPLAKKIAQRAVTANAGDSLYDAVKTMTSCGYSNLPVIDGGRIIGAISNKLIVEKIAQGFNYPGGLDGFMRSTSVSAALSSEKMHFHIASDDITADGALNLFTHNVKLAIVILTAGGDPCGSITGVLTLSDIVELNKLLN